MQTHRTNLQTPHSPPRSFGSAARRQARIAADAEAARTALLPRLSTLTVPVDVQLCCHRCGQPIPRDARMVVVALASGEIACGRGTACRTIDPLPVAEPTAAPEPHGDWRERARPWGREVYFRFRGRQYSKTFAIGTPTRVINEWAIRKRAEILDAAPARGTFGADVAHFLERYVPPPTATGKAWRRREYFLHQLTPWIGIFGKRARATIETQEIRQQLRMWGETGGLAASTLKHRRSALCSLWAALDGPDAPCPARKIRPREFRGPRPQPREIPQTLLDPILARMEESATKARLLVMLHTGMTQGELMAVTPIDVQLEKASPFVRVAHPGKTKKSREIPLSNAAIEAFRLFIRLKAWGTFSTSSMHSRFCHHAGKLGITGIRPYDLRHTFATRLRRAGADLADVQVLLGHTNPTTTERYSAVIVEKLRAAVNRADPATSADAPDNGGVCRTPPCTPNEGRGSGSSSDSSCTPGSPQV